MGGFTSLATAFSGLNAAQTGLYVTGHNMSNSGTEGFSRQRSVQKDFSYSTIGYTGMGALQVGLGTDVGQIQQIRDKYLDMSYRQEAGKLGYYSVKATTGDYVETILGELQSQYNAQSVVQNIKDSLAELMANPEAQETRADFIETCIVYVDKMTDVYDRLFSYQHNLDNQIRQMVSDINTLVDKINTLNTQIMRAQVSGDNPNDLRDIRSNYLDELSLYLDIEYSETKSGRVDIFTEGKELLVDGYQTEIGLQYISGDYSFVQPILGASKDGSIKAADAVPKPQTLFNYKSSVDATLNNDKGQLKSLFYTRGLYPANYTDTELKPPASSLSPADQERYYNMKNFYIPSLMAELDLIFNKIVTLINENMSPEDSTNGPYNNYAIKGDPDDEAAGLWEPIEIFKRVHYNQNDTGTGYYYLYTLGNVVVNPALSQDGGYNRIALSAGGDQSDNQVVLDILDKWKNPKEGIAFGGIETLDIDSAYNRFITRNGTITQEALTYVKEQTTLLNSIDNKRLSISGVSLDEEMKNMMVYQHAYNAAAKVINAIDGMIDKVINGTGRVGR